VLIEAIEGDGGRLSLVAAENCAGIAALETLKLFGADRPRCGVGIRLHKARSGAARAVLLQGAVWDWSGERARQQ